MALVRAQLNRVGRDVLFQALEALTTHDQLPRSPNYYILRIKGVGRLSALGPVFRSSSGVRLASSQQKDCWPIFLLSILPMQIHDGLQAATAWNAGLRDSKSLNDHAGHVPTMDLALGLQECHGPRGRIPRLYLTSHRNRRPPV